MTYFHYQARDAAGATHKGTIEAVSEVEAARKLKAGRLFPVAVKPARSARTRRVPDDHVIRFFLDFADLLQAGLPVDRTLSILRSNQTHRIFSRVTQDVLDDVQRGTDLSDALGKHRDVFGDLPAHMVRAGEASGTLPEILERLGQYMDSRRRFRQALVSAMIYPSFLFTMSAFSMVILLVYVIPKFAQIFEDLKQEIPFFTRVLLETGIFLQDWGWVLAVLALVSMFGGKYLLRLPAVQAAWDRALLKNFLTRRLVVQADLTRFCQTLGTLLKAGVPLLRALTLVSEVLRNSALRRALAPLQQEVKMGHAVSNFFRNQSLFPARVGTMLRVAEEQGNLAGGFIELSGHFEREMQRSLQRIMAFMEPVVIVVTGLVIGAMVFSMFTAILGINEIQF